MAEQTLALDGFETYFSEKLWELVPGVYRHEDGLAPINPGVLRALIEIVAAQAAALRRSHDRLWDDEFVELCDDWAVSYIGDLVGTRLVSALNPRARRVDVAKTIYYRRRAGTLTVLEELAADIAGWEGTVVEGFRRLARARHNLDPGPTAGAGALSGTPAGGIAMLRRPVAAELVDTAFDELRHTPDVRVTGRFGIPKVLFHLYRTPARPLVDVTPFDFGGGRFTFDPSGRDVPLHAPRSRPSDYAAWRHAREVELPAPVRCRLLGNAEFVVTAALVQSLGVSELSRLVGLRFPSESQLLRAAAAAVVPSALTAAQVDALLDGALAPDCGKSALLPSAIRVEQAGVTVPRGLTVAGALDGWSATAPDKRLVIDPERGRALFLGAAPGAPVTVGYWYGAAGEIGAGTYERVAGTALPADTTVSGGGAALGSAATVEADGITAVADSATYTPLADKSGIRSTTLRAADGERPFLLLAGAWTLDTGAENDSTLLLEGLWIGGGRELRLAGDYERVTIAHCTLDPGGEDAAGTVIDPVELVVQGQVEELRFESTIAGAVRVDGTGTVERLVVRDCVLGDVDLPDAEAALRAVTILGTTRLLRAHASETLAVGVVDVFDTQAGCFRFGAAPAGSRLPRGYRSHVLTETRALFASRRFGDPGYARLSEAAPRALALGAEDGSEIGAYSGLREAIRADGLRAKVDEFLPFGLIPNFIQET